MYLSIPRRASVMRESLLISLVRTCVIIIATTIWGKVTYPRIVQSCQHDGLSICKDVEQCESLCDRSGSDHDKRDESHSEFCKQQGIQLSIDLEVVDLY